MRKRLSTKTLTLRIVGASLIASAAIGGGLALQMASGHDPALGAGTANAQPRGSNDSQSDGTFDGSGQSGSSDFGQPASPAGGVTTRAS
jgi:hypothetical protein